MPLNKSLIVCCYSFFLILNTCFAQKPRLVLPIGHTSPVISASFSPDGKKIITGSSDNTTKIWDANTASLLANFKDDTGFEQAYYSPDGKKIITCIYKQMIVRDALTGDLLQNELFDEMLGKSSLSPDGTKIISSFDDQIRIINAQTGAIQKTITSKDFLNMTNDDMLEVASISFDNKQLAITKYLDPIVKIWDIKTRNFIKTLTGHTSTVNAVVFSPKGQYILTVSYDNTAKVWDAKTGSLIHTLSGHTKDVVAGQFSPDEKMVITGSADGTAKIWDTQKGALLGTLDGNTMWAIDAVNFSPDNKKVIISSGLTAKIWDVTTKALLNELKGHTKDVTAILFSPGQKNFLTVSDFKTVNKWDKNTGIIKNTWPTNLAFEKSEKDIIVSIDGQSILSIENDSKTLRNRDVETGYLIFEKHIKSAMLVDAGYSPDGKKIVAAVNNNIILILDAFTGATLHELKDPGSFNESVRFSPDSKTIVSASWDSTAKIWNAQTGEMLQKLPGHPGSVYQAVYTADGKKIVTVALSTYSYQSFVWEVETGKQLRNFAGTPFICFSNDHKTMLLQGAKDSVIVWDIALDKPLYTWLNEFKLPISESTIANDNLIITNEYGRNFTGSNIRTGKTIYQLESEPAQIGEAFFSNDGKQVITTWSDNTCRIMNSETGKLIYTFFIVDSIDYFLQIPSGYYQATSNASKLLHYVSSDLKVITFEQLDVRYNRPDKVLEAIGSTDTALIRSYRKAYEKRIKKLGIDTTAFGSGYSVPEADFANRDKVEFEQKDGKLKLDIKSGDSTYKLDRFNVWVNETPVFGQRGLSIRNKNVTSFDSSITINLSQGVNKIETSITNVNGTESYRMPLQVNYTPTNKQAEKTHFIGIGIDQFNDSKYNLKYSTKDIRDLSKKLKEKYSDIIIDTLFNEEVIISNIKALKQKLLQTSVNDKVIISYSGHGMLSKDFDYYLSTYSVNFDKPEENGLPYDELESLLDSIPARKKLMLIDACHSGEVDKDDLIALEATDKKLIKGLKPVAYKKEGQLGLKNSFELMQSLFVNVGKSTGATIISAAAGTEFALEGIDNLPNGVFTYSILESMNKFPSMKLSELKKTVGERVVELTKGLQKPTSRNETIAVDWEVW